MFKYIKSLFTNKFKVKMKNADTRDLDDAFDFASHSYLDEKTGRMLFTPNYIVERDNRFLYEDNNFYN